MSYENIQKFKEALDPEQHFKKPLKLKHGVEVHMAGNLYLEMGKNEVELSASEVRELLEYLQLADQYGVY